MTQELDNSLSSPEADNSQESPEFLSLDDIPFADDEPDQDPESSNDGDGHQDEEEGEGDDAAEGKGKALADDAEYTMPDGRKVTVGEMAKSFADFTVKTQELAAERNQSRQDALQAISQTREAQAQQLAFVAQHVMQLVAPGFDERTLMQLAQQDPDSYYQMKARMDVGQNFIAQLQQQAQQFAAQATQAKQQAEQEANSFQAQRQREATEALSREKWFNQDFGNKALSYMKSAGLPVDAIDAINKGMGGAAAITLVRKAMLYDEAVKQGKTKKQPPPQARTTPGAKPAQGVLGKTKQLNKAYEAGRRGDKAAAGAWLDNVL